MCEPAIYCFVPNTLETAADVEFYEEATAMPLIHDGRPFETVGQTLSYKLDGRPEPLPSRFVGRLIATVETHPELSDSLARAVSEAVMTLGTGPPKGLPAAVVKANQSALKSRTRRRHRR